jgi:hypothetical protein
MVNFALSPLLLKQILFFQQLSIVLLLNLFALSSSGVKSVFYFSYLFFQLFLFCFELFVFPIDKFSFSFLLVNIKGLVFDVLNFIILIFDSGFAHFVPERQLFDLYVNQCEFLLQTIVLLF